MQCSYDETFAKLDIRVGRIMEAENFTRARKPSYKLLVDFGPEIGMLKSSAQITGHYDREDLTGKLVIAVVNFTQRNIAGLLSQALVLGVYDASGEVVLLAPDKEVTPGSKIG